MQFDVADQKAVSSALEAWENEHPDDYIAYLVNNAGIRRDNMMFMMPQEDWHSVIDTTLNGFFYVTRALLPKMMMRRHGGRIVSVSSLSGLKGMAGQTNYARISSRSSRAASVLDWKLMITGIPIPASLRHIARPIPLEPPVTSAYFIFRRNFNIKHYHKIVQIYVIYEELQNRIILRDFISIYRNSLPRSQKLCKFTFY